MASIKAKVCVYCGKTYERLLEKHCPHCNEKVSSGMRKCPDCGEVFKMSKSKNNITGRFNCPKCSTELYFPMGRLCGHTLLYKDKEYASKIVELVEYCISERSGIVFAFDGSERSAELVHAYALLDRSKMFLKRQNDTYNCNPHDFTLELIQKILAEQWWFDNIKSLAMVRNQIGKFAQDLFRDKKMRQQQNEARRATFVDYSILEPVWN